MANTMGCSMVLPEWSQSLMTTQWLLSREGALVKGVLKVKCMVAACGPRCPLTAMLISSGPWTTQSGGAGCGGRWLAHSAVNILSLQKTEAQRGFSSLSKITQLIKASTGWGTWIGPFC